MTAPALPDFDELALRLVQLRRREEELVRRIERERERHLTFGSEFALRTLEALRGELEPLRAEITEIEAELRPVLRRPEQE